MQGVVLISRRVGPEPEPEAASQAGGRVGPGGKNRLAVRVVPRLGPPGRRGETAASLAMWALTAPALPTLLHDSSQFSPAGLSLSERGWARRVGMPSVPELTDCDSWRQAEFAWELHQSEPAGQPEPRHPAPGLTGSESLGPVFKVWLAISNSRLLESA